MSVHLLTLLDWGTFCIQKNKNKHLMRLFCGKVQSPALVRNGRTLLRPWTRSICKGNFFCFSLTLSQRRRCGSSGSVPVCSGWTDSCQWTAPHSWQSTFLSWSPTLVLVCPCMSPDETEIKKPTWAGDVFIVQCFYYQCVWGKNSLKIISLGWTLNNFVNMKICYI